MQKLVKVSEDGLNWNVLFSIAYKPENGQASLEVTVNGYGGTREIRDYSPRRTFIRIDDVIINLSHLYGEQLLTTIQSIQKLLMPAQL